MWSTKDLVNPLDVWESVRAWVWTGKLSLASTFLLQSMPNGTMILAEPNIFTPSLPKTEIHGLFLSSWRLDSVNTFKVHLKFPDSHESLRCLHLKGWLWESYTSQLSSYLVISSKSERVKFPQLMLGLPHHHSHKGVLATQPWTTSTVCFPGRQMSISHTSWWR